MLRAVEDQELERLGLFRCNSCGFMVELEYRQDHITHCTGQPIADGMDICVLSVWP